MLAWLAEFYTLTTTKKLHAALGETAREQVARKLLVAQQRSEAAEALWSGGHTAEALRLAVQALNNAAEASAPFAPLVGSSAVASPEVPAAPTAAPADSAAGASAADDSPGGSTTAVSPASPDAQAQSSESESADASLSEQGAAEQGATVDASDQPAASQSSVAPASVLMQVLVGRGVPAASAQAVVSSCEAAGAAALPEVDAEVSSKHEDLFRDVVDARAVIDRALAGPARSARQLRNLQALRWAWTSLAGLCVVAAVIYASLPGPAYAVRVSAVWNNAADHTGELLIDGREDTFWLLPDREGGWADMVMRAPRRVNRVGVLNSQNPPWNDRGTNEYRVEVYTQDGMLARSIDGAFQWGVPNWQYHDLGINNVSRVRVVVVSSHRTGAALAEVSVE